MIKQIIREVVCTTYTPKLSFLILVTQEEFYSPSSTTSYGDHFFLLKQKWSIWEANQRLLRAILCYQTFQGSGKYVWSSQEELAFHLTSESVADFLGLIPKQVTCWPL